MGSKMMATKIVATNLASCGKTFRKGESHNVVLYVSLYYNTAGEGVPFGPPLALFPHYLCTSFFLYPGHKTRPVSCLYPTTFSLN